MPQVYSEKQANVLLNANARWNLLVGAVRSGKTWVSYDLLLKRIVELPKGDCALIGKTERTVVRNVIRPLQKRFGNAVSNINKYGEVKICGRVFYIIGANDERAIDKIRGLSLIYAYCDEFASLPASCVSMLKSRLSEPGALADCTFNPEGPYHWAKADFVDKASKINAKVFHFTLDDNPFLPADYVESIKREYTGVWYKRLILGEWCQADGIIYDMFSEDRHVISSIPEIRIYFVACDYGTTNPTAFLLGGIGYDNCLYILKEYYWDSAKEQRQKTDIEYSSDLKQFISGYNPEWVFIDPNAASFKTQCYNDGIPNIANASNRVTDGIRYTSSLFSQNRIKIHSSCSNLLKEIQGYIWDTKAQKWGEDKPVKQRDHACDSLRYLCYGLRNELGY